MAALGNLVGDLCRVFQLCTHMQQNTRLRAHYVVICIFLGNTEHFAAFKEKVVLVTTADGTVVRSALSQNFSDSFNLDWGLLLHFLVITLVDSVFSFGSALIEPHCNYLPKNALLLL